MRLLRDETTIFKWDAVMAAVLGASMVALAGELHALAGGGLSSGALRAVGLALLPWAAHNWFTGRAPLRTAHVMIQLGGDATWLVSSVVIIATHAMNTVGTVIYVAQTLTVACVFAAKLQALRVHAVALRHQ